MITRRNRTHYAPIRDNSPVKPKKVIIRPISHELNLKPKLSHYWDYTLNQMFKGW